MHLYIQVGFWVGVIATLGRLLLLCCATYPRSTSYSAGGDAFGLVVGLIFTFWAWTLL